MKTTRPKITNDLVLLEALKIVSTEDHLSQTSQLWALPQGFLHRALLWHLFLPNPWIQMSQDSALSPLLSLQRNFYRANSLPFLNPWSSHFQPMFDCLLVSMCGYQLYVLLLTHYNCFLWKPLNGFLLLTMTSETQKTIQASMGWHQ